MAGGESREIAKRDRRRLVENELRIGDDAGYAVPSGADQLFSWFLLRKRA